MEVFLMSLYKHYKHFCTNRIKRPVKLFCAGKGTAEKLFYKNYLDKNVKFTEICGIINIKVY